MAIGDVTSTERGSGARYNDGKPDLSLIPLSQIAASFLPLEHPKIRLALLCLGDFQVTGDADFLLEAQRHLKAHWRDCARVFEYGKAKYAAWNWAKGMPWSVPLGCAARHALDILEGVELDPESGQPHAAHIMANVVMLLHFVRTFPEGNDLPPPEYFETA